MNDQDKMPFGRHKGLSMQEVPADYLDHIIGQPWISKWPDVERYIEDNRKAIDMELEEADKDRLR